MLDIFNRKKLANLEAENARLLKLTVESSQYATEWQVKAQAAMQTSSLKALEAHEWKLLCEKTQAELTAIKEKQRENSRKGALAANAKRRAAKEGANA